MQGPLESRLSRQDKAEARTGGVAALQLQAPASLERQLLTERETQPAAARLATHTRLKEP